MEGQLSDKVKKNLLDLQYNKYLQYYTTAVILLFTYFIGVGIAFITEQVDYKNINQMLLLAMISIAILSIIIILMLQYKGHMANIFEEIKRLKL